MFLQVRGITALLMICKFESHSLIWEYDALLCVITHGLTSFSIFIS